MAGALPSPRARQSLLAELVRVRHDQTAGLFRSTLADGLVAVEEGLEDALRVFVLAALLGEIGACVGLVLLAGDGEAAALFVLAGLEVVEGGIAGVVGFAELVAFAAGFAGWGCSFLGLLAG